MADNTAMMSNLVEVRRVAKPKKHYARAAAKAPGWLRHVKTTKWSARKERGYRNRKLGKMGAASPGRVIMKDGELVDA